jgi:DNA segregation ATPase FtsK/SpoIIIE, S-DNA-T family
VASRRRSKSSRGRKRARAAARGQWRESFAEQLADHRSDTAAIALGVAGVLSALGIFWDRAGPVGSAIDTAAAAMLGRGKIIVPIALLSAAVLTLAQRRDDMPRMGVRLGLGIGLVSATTVGLLHLGRSAPDDRSLHALEHAGGVLGAGVGAPLRALLGSPGAVIVLLAAGVLGCLLIAGTGIRQIAHATATAARVVGRYSRELLTLRARPADDTTGAPQLYDQRADELDVDLTTDADFDPYVDITEDELGAGDEEDEELDADESEDEDADGEDEDDGEYDEAYEDDDEEYDEEGEDEDGEYDDDEDPAEDEDDDVAAVAAATTAEQLAIHLPPGHQVSAWKLPAATILKRSQSREVDLRMVEQGGDVLEATMREFGVDARRIGQTVGPTVTRYELELAPGVKVNKVTGLAKEIAYAMASHDVRILAPIPGRSAIGVEVPNKTRPLVTLGDILSSDEAKRAKHPLEVAMGRDIAGNAVLANLSNFPHVLIAGQTGAGKSSCINSIVTSLLMRTTPDQVRLILVDPKRVELGQYNGVPHLLTEVVTNPKKAANALDWAVREMELRYDLLAEVGVRDISGYNSTYDRGELPTANDPDPETGKTYDRLPFIVVVVDELADLMMVAARDVETSICRLAQMARAVGIHLVIATQRPSVDVITGVIKANIPSRLAFSVSTLADSRVILDQPGAEKLIGKGDMLMLTASSSRTERIQGAWVDEECVRKVVAHWRRQAIQPLYIEGIQGDDSTGSSRLGMDADDTDDLLDQAMELVVMSGLGSTSMLQRKLRVGFARAGRIMDLLERRGVVGPSEGSKARAVLMTVDELEELRERE